MLEWQIDQYLTTRTTAARELTAIRQQLEHEQTRLLQAYYADAVPLDLLKRESERIDSALNDVDIRLEQQRRGAGELRHALGLALEVLDSVTDAYLTGGAAVRRSCNQALFAKLLVNPERLRPRYHQPYGLLLHRKVGAIARTWTS